MVRPTPSNPLPAPILSKITNIFCSIFLTAELQGHLGYMQMFISPIQLVAFDKLLKVVLKKHNILLEIMVLFFCSNPIPLITKRCSSELYRACVVLRLAS